jgi:cell division protein FtsI (penicillin-binding protein 3)
MGMTVGDSSARGQWVRISNEEGTTVMRRMTASADLMPSLQGMGLRDAMYLLENMKLKVVPLGRGKVRSQSIQAGARVQRGQTVYLEMGLP